MAFAKQSRAHIFMFLVRRCACVKPLGNLVIFIVFSEALTNGVDIGNHIHTEKQEADAFTEPVRDDPFPKLRCMLVGWCNELTSRCPSG